MTRISFDLDELESFAGYLISYFPDMMELGNAVKSIKGRVENKENAAPNTPLPTVEQLPARGVVSTREASLNAGDGKAAEPKCSCVAGCVPCGRSLDTNGNVYIAHQHVKNHENCPVHGKGEGVETKVETENEDECVGCIDNCNDGCGIAWKCDCGQNNMPRNVTCVKCKKKRENNDR